MTIWTLSASLAIRAIETITGASWRSNYWYTISIAIWLVSWWTIWYTSRSTVSIKNSVIVRITLITVCSIFASLTMHRTNFWRESTVSMFIYMAYTWAFSNTLSCILLRMYESKEVRTALIAVCRIFTLNTSTWTVLDTWDTVALTIWLIPRRTYSNTFCYILIREFDSEVIWVTFIAVCTISTI